MKLFNARTISFISLKEVWVYIVTNGGTNVRKLLAVIAITAIVAITAIYNVATLAISLNEVPQNGIQNVKSLNSSLSTGVSVYEEIVKYI